MVYIEEVVCFQVDVGFLLFDGCSILLWLWLWEGVVRVVCQRGRIHLEIKLTCNWPFVVDFVPSVELVCLVLLVLKLFLDLRKNKVVLKSVLGYRKIQ